MSLDDTLKNAFSSIDKKWDEEIIPTLCDYIKIPNKSPMFDPDWQDHGYMDQAMQLIVDWCKQQPIKDMQMELIREKDRTPLLFIEIPGQTDDTILLYGHMDKQPEMVGWDDDLGPWKPVIKGHKLYGRGGADDGYSTFAALTTILTLQQNNIPHARCVVIIEGSEESGSNDLPFYLTQLKSRIGKPSLIICLDSGSGNYEQLWSTTSLRGIIGGELTVQVINEGIHSGYGSGAVPAAFRVLELLLDRIEDRNSGEITVPELKVEIPAQRMQQAKDTANTIGDKIKRGYPWSGNTTAVSDDAVEILLNRTWRAALSVTGIDGLPPIKDAGNVTIPKISVKLSMRIPPTCDADKVHQTLKQILEDNPPYNATVTYHAEDTASGWHAPALSEWLEKANERASQIFYEKPAAYFGEGGSIPFMGMLGEMFPEAQFLITGLLGPKSNAHGPNEFLHIPMAKNLTGCVAAVIAFHFNR